MWAILINPHRFSQVWTKRWPKRDKVTFKPSRKMRLEHLWRRLDLRMGWQMICGSAKKCQSWDRRPFRNTVY